MTNYVLTVESSDIVAAGGDIQGRVIANFALQHLLAACTFRDKVLELESANTPGEIGPFFQDIRSYTSACIMSCAAGLEALINELFIAHNTALRKNFPDFEKTFWAYGGIERKPILKKYKLALETIGAEVGSEELTAKSDVWWMIELRNALVHFKPAWDPQRKCVVDLACVLEGKYETSPFTDRTADFVSMRSMSYGCAAWAVAVTLTFIQDFNSRSRLDDQKLSGFVSLK